MGALAVTEQAIVNEAHTQVRRCPIGPNVMTKTHSPGAYVAFPKRTTQMD